jgi:N-acetylglutamate synthase-like GNAT family acetyltransferase
MMARSKPPRLFAFPLKTGERGALSKALAKARLPVDDVEVPGPLFWRFETTDSIPVGFGGLEIHGEDALMRSVVILPPLRSRGIGTALVAQLENEAALHGCPAVWLLTEAASGFFDRLGYAKCDRAVVPQKDPRHPAIRGAMSDERRRARQTPARVIGRVPADFAALQG